MGFVKGLELSRAFFADAVQPILARRLPQLQYSAGLIGSGSEIIGYDDPVSTDHHWGPRAMLFLSPADHRNLAEPVSTLLAEELPVRFMGYSTNFSAPKTEDGDQGTQLLVDINGGPVNHRVEILTLAGFMRDYLGLAVERPLRAADWLSLPQHKLLSFTAGALFRDDLHVQAARDRLHYYPRDVWLYMLACGWSRIGQDEHLAPRAGAVGDELGAALISGRLVRSIMQLCFLLQRRYAPYPKWFGTAFAELDCGQELSPVLRSIQLSENWRDRQRRLCAALEILNRLHNVLRLTAPIQPATQEFHGRGFKVGNAWRYIRPLLAEIRDPEMQAISDCSLIGSIDQFSDNTDLLEATRLREKVASLHLD